MQQGRRSSVCFACLVILIVAASACARLAAEQDNTVPQRDMVDRYVEAFNTGEATALMPVLAEMYSPQFLASLGGTAAAAWDRMELFRTYGPLEFEYVDTLATPPIVWTRGTISRGWVGHQLFLSGGEDAKVTRHSIWRARPVPYPEAVATRSEVAALLQQYLGALADAGHFSGSVSVSHRGVSVLEGSWGSDGQLVPAPITSTTRFHIASVTKLFTATSVLQLVEAGVVTLDDPIGRWIPEYPVPYRDSVRIRHLLTHTSGIELDDDARYLAEIREARNASDLLRTQLRYVEDREPPFPPGSEYDYTSEGYDLLGVIVERATGQPWTQLVHERLLERAGMNKTRFAVPLDEGGWALGRTSLNVDLRTTTPGFLRSALEILPVVAKPSAGMWSTAGELHSFMRALVEYRLLGRSWTDSLLSPHVETGELPKYGIRSWVGLGAQGEDVWGIRMVGHGGVVPGYSAAIEYLPNNGWLLAVATSSGEASAFLVIQRFLELVGTAES